MADCNLDIDQKKPLERKVPVASHRIAQFRRSGRITRNPEVGRAGRGGATMILPGETEAALRGRNHAEG